MIAELGDAVRCRQRSCAMSTHACMRMRAAETVTRERLQVIPKSERAAENNHGNYYDVQLLYVLKYLQRCAHACARLICLPRSRLS